MKLIRLKSIANNAIRSSIWTPEPMGIDPFHRFRPRETIVVDLISGDIKPERQGDDVERFYKAMSKWFHRALKKEKIPLSVIESAKITISPSGKKCIITAQGKEFESEIAY